jgi:PmbA protein
MEENSIGKAREIARSAITGGFDEAAVMLFDRRRSYLKIANSKIDSIVEKKDIYAMMFASSRKRNFFTNIEDLSKKGIEERIRRARSMVERQKPKDDYYGMANGPFKYKGRDLADRNILACINCTMEDIAGNAISGAEDAGRGNAVAGMLQVGHLKTFLATSNGAEASGTSTYARLNLRIYNDRSAFQDVAVSRRLNDIMPHGMGTKAGEMFRMGNGREGKIEKGTYDVIYLQLPAGLLLSNINSMACISSVETGSYLAGKMGKQVANRNVNIYDDGASPELVGSSRFDAEGYPTQKTPIIRNGVLENYLHNYSTAMKYKKKSTGNAGLVLPSPNTTVVECRKTVDDVRSLVSKVDKGILVTNTWYTRFSNYLKGDFSTVPRDLAYYIENGEIKFSIRQTKTENMVGIRISDNMIRMMENVDYAARDARQTSSWDYEEGSYVAPSVLVRGANVTVA